MTALAQRDLSATRSVRGARGSVEIELTWREVYLAGIVNVSRTVDNLCKGRKDRYGLEYEDMGEAFGWLGAIGEVAVAKHLNCYWITLEPGVVDVGNVEVRAVGADRKRLMLHPTDKGLLPFVSVLVERQRLPLVTLRGWIMGRDGKRNEYWQDPKGGRPAFFVPNDQLLPMSELPR